MDTRVAAERKRLGTKWQEREARLEPQLARMVKSGSNMVAALADGDLLQSAIQLDHVRSGIADAWQALFDSDEDPSDAQQPIEKDSSP